MDKNKIKLEILSDLWAIREYLEILEQTIPSLLNKEVRKNSLINELFDLDDDPNNSINEEYRLNLVLLFLHRYPRASFIVLLWSFFENAVTKLADYYCVNQESGNTLVPFQLIRGNPVQRLLIYFSDYGWVPVEDDDLKSLNLLYKIRNNIVHQHMYLSKNDTQFKNYEKQGIRVIRNDLIIDELYCRNALNTVSVVLDTLIDVALSFP